MTIDGFRYMDMTHLRWHCPTHNSTFSATDDYCAGIYDSECAPWVAVRCGCDWCLILNDQPTASAA